MERRRATFVALVNVGAAIQQDAHNPQIRTGVRRQAKGRVSVPVPRVDIGPVVEQAPDGRTGLVVGPYWQAGFDAVLGLGAPV